QLRRRPRGEHQPGPGRAGPGRRPAGRGRPPPGGDHHRRLPACWGPRPPAPRRAPVHPGLAELGRLYQPDLAVNAAVGPFLAAWRSVPPARGDAWAAWTEAARSNYQAWARPWPAGGAQVDLGQVMATLRERLPDDAVVANGAGNFAIWVHRYFQF